MKNTLHIFVINKEDYLWKRLVAFLVPEQQKVAEMIVSVDADMCL